MMNGDSGNREKKLSDMSFAEVELLVNKFEVENHELRRQLLISLQRTEGVSTAGDQIRPIQSLMDQLRYYQWQIMVMKGQLMSSRLECKDKDALIKDLQDQLYNLKAGNMDAVKKLFETNEIIQKQQCNIVDLLMTYGETNPPNQAGPSTSADKRSGDEAGGKQRSSQPSTSRAARVGNNGGVKTKYKAIMPPAECNETEMYDPAAPKMTPSQQLANISTDRSLLNTRVFPDSNILNLQVSSVPNQSGTKRICFKSVKQEPE